VADTLAVTALFNAVVVQFTADSTNTPNVFGWRAKNQQLVTGRRIVWVPGDDSSGSIGRISAPRKEPGLPRPIANLDELVTVYVHSGEVPISEDESKAYYAARVLFDAWFRAVYRYAHGNIQIVGTPSWVTDKLERREGATIRCVLAVGAFIPDRPLGITDPIQQYPTGEVIAAELTTTTLEQEDTIEVSEESP
jgi:hypothetical protein